MCRIYHRQKITTTILKSLFLILCHIVKLTFNWIKLYSFDIHNDILFNESSPRFADLPKKKKN